MLAKHHPMLFIEVGDYSIRNKEGIAEDNYEYGTVTRSLLGAIAEHGYKFYYEEDLSPMNSIEELLDKYTLYNSTTNLFAWV